VLVPTPPRPLVTRLLTLLGHPVAHSRSPAMMRSALASFAIDATYVACDVLPPQLPDAVRGLRALGFAGANVTLPHKRAVLALCDEADPIARACGAANTLVPLRDGRLLACNTDAPGAAAALAEGGVDLAGATVVLFGAGGAARAVAVGCAEARAHAIRVVARDALHAEETAQAALRAPRVRGARGFSSTSVSWADEDRVREAVAEATVLVQCTPLGMDGHRGPGTVADEEALVRWVRGARKKTAVMDLVYAPRETALLQAARERGLRCIDGLGMLAHQGALWGATR
jgi:shikimate dehydrogenase